ncbi:hypothetical protein [Modestobacter sp. SYSU DS0657]
MTRLRRALVLLALTLAGVLGLTTIASAAFSGSTAPQTVTVGTTTVQPVTGLSTAGSYCTPDGRLEVRLSWNKSTTPRVTSYRIKATTLFGLVNVTAGTVNAGQTGFAANMGDTNWGGYSFTVTTTTDYGWTAESARTGTLRC